MTDRTGTHHPSHPHPIVPAPPSPAWATIGRYPLAAPSPPAGRPTDRVPGDVPTARFRFLHTADLHLDSPFRGLAGGVPASVAPRLAAATLDAWSVIVDLAIAESVAFVVIAGDTFDADARTIRGPLALVRGLERLAAHGIPAFVAAGHSDPLDAWEPGLRLPDGVVRFGASFVEAHPIVREGREIARVHGISHAHAASAENLAARFRAEPGSPFAVAVLHANVGGRPGIANVAPCAVGDLVGSGIGYWALGHDHHPSVLDVAAPAIVYPGSPQALDPDETGPRGAVLVTVEDDGSIATELRPVDAVRPVVRTVYATGVATIAALSAILEATLEEALAEAGRPVVARIAIEGTGTVGDAIARHPGGLPAIADGVSRGFATRRAWAWIAALEDRTQRTAPAPLAADRSGIAAEIDRVADEAATALRAGTGDPAGVRAALDALLAQPGLRAAVGEPDADALDAIVAEARERVAAAIGGGR